MKLSLPPLLTSKHIYVNKQTRMKTKIGDELVFEMHRVEMNTVNLNCFINILGTFTKIFGVFIS